MHTLEALVSKLEQPQTLSMYAGPNDMALALLEERAEILAALQSLAPSGWQPIAWADMRLRGDNVGLSWDKGVFHNTPLYTPPAESSEVK